MQTAEECGREELPSLGVSSLDSAGKARPLFPGVDMSDYGHIGRGLGDAIILLLGAVGLLVVVIVVMALVWVF